MNKDNNLRETNVAILRNDVKKVFDEEEEKQLEKYLEKAAYLHMGLNSKQVRELAYQFAVMKQKQNIPSGWHENNMAGLGWLRYYRKCHPHLSLRKPKATSLARASSFNGANVSILPLFQLPNDMENYMEYNIMGSVSAVRIKPGCAPSKFDCQSKRQKQTFSSKRQPYFVKNKIISKKKEKYVKLNETNSLTEYLAYGDSCDGNSVSVKTENSDPDGCNDTSDVVRGSRTIQESEETNSTMEVDIKLEPDDDVPVKNPACDCDVTSVNITDDMFKIEREGVEFRPGNTLSTDMTITVQELKKLLYFENSIISDAKLKMNVVVPLQPIFIGICEHCGQNYHSKQELHTHIMSTHACWILGVNCKHCNYISHSPKEQENHTRLYHKKQYHECYICHKNYKYPAILKFHMRSHTHDRPYKCDYCDKCYSQKRILISHRRTHTGEKPYKCDICHKSFNVSSILNTHKRSHTGEKPYECDVCKKRFSVNTTLITHMRTHTGERPFECDICKKCFIQKSRLTFHKRSHSGDKPYECDFCGRCFSYKSYLIPHINTHTGAKPHKCDVCKIRFARTVSLNIHLRTHTGEKPYKCDVCAKCFNEKGKLNIHQRTHTGEKPYKCDNCGKCYIDRGKLTIHIRSHTGEKPYECNICSRRFSMKGHLNNHIKLLHTTSDRPYKCVVCAKCFREKCKLNIHLRTHTSEKPYKCDTCDKSYDYRGKLTIHMRSHTGEKPYECNLCSKRFSDISLLNRHIKLHTREKHNKCLLVD